MKKILFMFIALIAFTSGCSEKSSISDQESPFNKNSYKPEQSITGANIDSPDFTK